MYVSYKVIGDHLRTARKAKSLTQEKLAELLDMSPINYARFERGERPISLEHLANIANQLNVPTFSLLSGSLLYEPLSAVPTAESIAFVERLSRITSRCTAQELETLEEICALFSRKNAAC